jgi:hypothetical protein
VRRRRRRASAAALLRVDRERSIQLDAVALLQRPRTIAELTMHADRRIPVDLRWFDLGRLYGQL